MAGGRQTLSMSHGKAGTGRGRLWESERLRDDSPAPLSPRMPSPRSKPGSALHTWDFERTSGILMEV